MLQSVPKFRDILKSLGLLLSFNLSTSQSFNLKILAKIIPFKAVRPTRDKVSLVTSRSYDEYSPGELASQLDFNPFSFLHVLNPAYVNQQKAGLEKRFKLVAQKYRDFKEEEVFLKEEEPVFFIYEIETKNFKQN